LLPSRGTAGDKVREEKGEKKNPSMYPGMILLLKTGPVAETEEYKSQ